MASHSEYMARVNPFAQDDKEQPLACKYFCRAYTYIKRNIYMFRNGANAMMYKCNKEPYSRSGDVCMERQNVGATLWAVCLAGVHNNELC